MPAAERPARQYRAVRRGEDGPLLARYALTFDRGTLRHRLRTRAEAAGLATLVEHPHLLFAAPAGTPFLAAGGSLLVGDLYERSGDHVASIEQGSFDALRTLGPNAQFWGNFALFDANARSAYRDPSGNVALYHCEAAGGHLFVSDADLAWRLQLLPAASLDPIFAVHWLQYPFLRTARTGLAGVGEVLPGARRTIGQQGGWSDEPLWRPSLFIGRDNAIGEPAAAAAAVRSGVLSAIPAQVRGRSLLLQLSGGLDSSIIAAALGDAPAQVRAVNFATRSADGDERRFAREVAACFGIELDEILETDRGADGPPAAPMFRPPVNPLLGTYQSALEAAARQAGAPLLVDGGGGDNLFCYVTSAAPAIDAFASGRPARALQAIHDIAERAGCTWWQAAAGAARRTLHPAPGWREDRSFLDPRALLGRCEQHPWMDGLDRALPGKRDHVHALIEIHHFLDRGCAPDIARLHPLLPQPLLEACLRIPSWLWLAGGRDRAIARDAFADLLPASVLRRRAKGSLESLFHRSFASLRPWFREMLLGGELRRLQLIDHAAVEAAFADEGEASAERQLRLSEMVALEQWLRWWRCPPGAAAEAPAAGPTADTGQA